jgi:hypothetical protein
VFGARPAAERRSVIRLRLVMNNIHLNPGGVIGGLVCPIVVFVVLFTPNGKYELLSKLVVGAVVGGAIVGNWTWGKLFQRPLGRPKAEESTSREDAG